MTEAIHQELFIVELDACPHPQWCKLDPTGCLGACSVDSLVTIEDSGAGNCPDLRACMRDRCIGACTDKPPEPEPNAA